MFEEIYPIIMNSDSIVIFGHENPDGDCYGSQVGLKEAILATWPSKKVYIVGSGLPYLFSRLGEMDKVSEKTIEDSLAVVLDFNILSRAEDKRISKAKRFIKIDHHISQIEFIEGVEVKDVTSSSSAQLVLELIKETGMKLTKRGAEALFVGLVMDTGRFLYLEKDGRSFKSANELLKYHIDTKALYDIMYEADEHSIALKGYVYSHYKKTGHGVIYLVITKDVLEKYEVSTNNAAGLVNLLSNINGFPIWAFFVELENKKMRVELRSKYTPVQPIAVKYGGGGHLNAAGISDTVFSTQMIDNIVRDLDNALEEGE
jgi:phosphoesterase RecJ-like protein